MGESFSAITQSAAELFNFENISGLFATLINMLPAPVLALYAEHTVPFLLVAICLLVLLAFEGYRIFKMLMFVGSAAVFGIGGYWYIAPLIPESAKALDLLNMDALIAVLCALLALFLTKCAYSFMIMLLGGAIGYYIGSTYVFD